MAITVVVVEDEDNARLNILEHLNSLGYETLGFSTLAEARACWSGVRETFLLWMFSCLMAMARSAH